MFPDMMIHLPSAGIMQHNKKKKIETRLHINRGLLFDAHKNKELKETKHVFSIILVDFNSFRERSIQFQLVFLFSQTLVCIYLS